MLYSYTHMLTVGVKGLINGPCLTT